MARCSNCHELIGDTMKELEEHHYGDNPYAKYCQSITELQSDVENQSWWSKLLGRVPDTSKKNTALNNLLRHKMLVSEYMTTENNGQTLESFLKENS